MGPRSSKEMSTTLTHTAGERVRMHIMSTQLDPVHALQARLQLRPAAGVCRSFGASSGPRTFCKASWPGTLVQRPRRTWVTNRQDLSNLLDLHFVGVFTGEGQVVADLQRNERSWLSCAELLHCRRGRLLS